jgi:hypothetical protein
MSEVVRIPALSLEYRLLQEEYRGPATVAWRAEHLTSGLTARVTMVAPPPRCSEPSLEAICLAFRRALERAGAFTAPDILPYDAAAEHEGMPCAITLLPEGTLLSDAMSIAEPVFVPKVMQIGSVIGHALARLHDAGLWHGFLHPGNILIVGNERPALLDHLVHAAAATAAWQEGLPVSGSTYVGVGERAFRELDPYLDVYGLAAILLRIMTGSSPETMLMEQIERQLPQALPTSLRQDLVAALNIGPHSRPPTARTLAVHLSFDVAWLKATAELGPTTNGVAQPTANGHGPASGATVTEESDRASSDEETERARAEQTATDTAPGGETAVEWRAGSEASVDRLTPKILALPRSTTAAAPGVGDAPLAPPRGADWGTRSAGTPYAGPPPGSVTSIQPTPLAGSRPQAVPPPAPAWSAAPATRPWSPPPSLILGTLAVLVGVCIPAGIYIGKSQANKPLGVNDARQVSGGVETRVLPGRRETLVFEVQLGPYPDEASAKVIQQAIAAQEPDAFVVLDGGEAFVQLPHTLYSQKAQRMVERFEQAGYRARIHRATRAFTP